MIQKQILDSSPSHVGYLSTYPPRECGIANFTKDLIDSIADLEGFKHSIIAINEKGALYDYDRRVKWNIEGRRFTLWSPRGPEFGKAQVKVDAANKVKIEKIWVVGVMPER